ncbi:16S rRNA (guanine(527)-N(7))-methyltransferase RsmG [Wukongibacter baidiensis]|uniref:16S rRNA (guanine(527)-N(7))-methyltransferase RsmG n=1 Tax=Wukongibacter baidiensis TaxID=1723361 RepID=UPI003D7F77A5
MNNKDILKQGGQELGLDIDERMIDRFIKYKDLLIEWNKKINLTGITEDKEIMIKHFLDSLACMLTGVVRNDSKIIDVGTGAGFPGIPLKVFNENIDLTLLDSLNKRIKYLQTVCDELELSQVEFLHGRAEDYGRDKDYREKYDIAVARAVAELSVLCEYCLPFVKVNGYFIALKGPKAQDEIGKAKKALSILGGEIVDTLNVNLPFSDAGHNLVIIKKTKPMPSKYPRKAGTPTKKPLT